MFVLDACALLDYFLTEQWAKHRHMVEFLKAHGYECSIHAMNMTEVFYLVLDKSDLAKAEETLRLTRTMGINIIDSMPDELLTDAGWLKVTYDLGMLDAIAFATARYKKATLITRDRKAFEGIMKANIHPVKLY